GHGQPNLMPTRRVQRKRRPRRPHKASLAGLRDRRYRSLRSASGTNLLGLRTLGALRDLELDGLVLIQTLVAITLDGREVDYQVASCTDESGVACKCTIRTCWLMHPPVEFSEDFMPHLPVLGDGLRPRQVVTQHVIPRVVEATVVPSAIFFVAWHFVGTWPAL